MFDPIKLIFVDGKPVIRFFTGMLNDFIHIQFHDYSYLVMAMEEVLDSTEVIERYFEQKNGLGFFVRDDKAIRFYMRHDNKIINILITPEDLKKVYQELKKSS